MFIFLLFFADFALPIYFIWRWLFRDSVSTRRHLEVAFSTFFDLFSFFICCMMKHMMKVCATGKIERATMQVCTMIVFGVSFFQCFFSIFRFLLMKRWARNSFAGDSVFYWWKTSGWLPKICALLHGECCIMIFFPVRDFQQNQLGSFFL